jgi:hypothetical protein
MDMSSTRLGMAGNPTQQRWAAKQCCPSLHWQPAPKPSMLHLALSPLHISTFSESVDQSPVLSWSKIPSTWTSLPLRSIILAHAAKSPLLLYPNPFPCSRNLSHLCMCMYSSDSQTQREQSVTWACSALGCGIGSSLLHNTTCQHVEQHQWENQRPKDHPEYKEPPHALVQEPIC